jgi:hypothetical protein
MQLVLGDHGLYRRELEHLMALRLGVVAVQGLLAPGTARGVQRDDFVDVFYREQRPRLAAVPGLPPRATSTGLTATAQPLA